MKVHFDSTVDRMLPSISFRRSCSPDQSILVIFFPRYRFRCYLVHRAIMLLFIHIRPLLYYNHSQNEPLRRCMSISNTDSVSCSLSCLAGIKYIFLLILLSLLTYTVVVIMNLYEKLGAYPLTIKVSPDTG